MIGTKIGFDLGTSTVLAYVDGKGVRINEPSVIAYDTFTEKIKAVGKDAYKMVGRSPDSVTVVQPIRDGTVFDYGAVQNMLAFYIQKLCGNQIFKPNVIVSVPSQVSELDKRTVLDIVTSAGAARACVIEEPLVASIGAKIDNKLFRGTMIVDIGGGTTNIAVVTGGLVAKSSSITIAGNVFDDVICKYVRYKYDIIIGSVTAEAVKKQIGTVKKMDAELAVRSVGKDSTTMLPKTIELTSSDMYECLREPIDRIIDNIKSVLMETPPELNADISVNGIVLTGGGALLRGIDKYIENKLGIRTRCADDPVCCVINGIGYYLKNMEELENNGYVFKTYQDINDFEE